MRCQRATNIWRYSKHWIMQSYFITSSNAERVIECHLAVSWWSCVSRSCRGPLPLPPWLAWVLGSLVFCTHECFEWTPWSSRLFVFWRVRCRAAQGALCQFVYLLNAHCVPLCTAAKWCDKPSLLTKSCFLYWFLPTCLNVTYPQSTSSLSISRLSF